VFTKGKLDIQAATFDLDDTLYDNLPVIMNAGHRLPSPPGPRAFVGLAHN
jgi:FMN phosphatase YigB (HAD superfamily)